MKLRQMEPKHIEVGGYNFYIRPFPALKAANLTGELASVLTPVLGGLISLVDINGLNEGDGDLLDIDVNKAAPNITQAFSVLSGDKVESLLKKLLISGKNIAIDLSDEDNSGGEILTEDILNDIFCGEVQNMFILAFEVIRLNFNGFFKKVASLFGKASGGMMKKMNLKSMGSLTQNNLEN